MRALVTLFNQDELLSPSLANTSQAGQRVVDAIQSLLAFFKESAKPRTRIPEGLMPRQWAHFKQSFKEQMMAQAKMRLLQKLSALQLQSENDALVLAKLLQEIIEGSEFPRISQDVAGVISMQFSCRSIPEVALWDTIEVQIDLALADAFLACLSKESYAHGVFDSPEDVKKKKREDLRSKKCEGESQEETEHRWLSERKARDQCSQELQYQQKRTMIRLMEQYVDQEKKNRTDMAMRPLRSSYASPFRSFDSLPPTQQQWEYFFIESVKQFALYGMGESAERACYMAFFLFESLRDAGIRVSIESYFEKHFVVVLQLDASDLKYVVDPLLNPEQAWYLDEYLEHVCPEPRESKPSYKHPDPARPVSYFDRNLYFGARLESSNSISQFSLSDGLVDRCRQVIALALPAVVRPDSGVNSSGIPRPESRASGQSSPLALVFANGKKPVTNPVGSVNSLDLV